MPFSHLCSTGSRHRPPSRRKWSKLWPKSSEIWWWTNDFKEDASRSALIMRLRFCLSRVQSARALRNLCLKGLRSWSLSASGSSARQAINLKFTFPDHPVKSARLSLSLKFILKTFLHHLNLLSESFPFRSSLRFTTTVLQLYFFMTKLLFLFKKLLNPLFIQNGSSIHSQLKSGWPFAWETKSAPKAGQLRSFTKSSRSQTQESFEDQFIVKVVIFHRATRKFKRSVQC